jgi:hypothetical protein
MRLLRAQRPAVRWIIGVLAIALLGVTAAFIVPASRDSLLRSLGWALVAHDTPGKADIIIVATDSLGAGVLEVADLVHAGIATRVAVFARARTRVQTEFERRGVPYFDATETAIQQLRGLGITSIDRIPWEVAGTDDEAKVLQWWCAANHIHSVVFVSVSDHSRRTRRVLGRTLGAHGIKVMVEYSRYSDFDPDIWWRSRGGQRTELIEAEKLLLDILKHPFW